MRNAVAGVAGLVVAVVGCASPGTPSANQAGQPGTPSALASAPSAEAEPSEDPPDEARSAGMPTKCTESASGSVCVPPDYFAKALCNADYPTVAVAMFANGTPWTRGYSVTTSAAWNASGGASSNEKMKMYEELVVLRHRAPSTDGIQVSGSGNSYDVLRWDGSCVTLQQGELSFNTPPRIASARVIFKHLELHVRDALKQDPELRPLYLSHRKECKGVTMGAVSKKCEKVDQAFSEAIAAQVRAVGGIPTPHKLPQP